MKTVLSKEYMLYAETKSEGVELTLFETDVVLCPLTPVLGRNIKLTMTASNELQCEFMGKHLMLREMNTCVEKICEFFKLEWCQEDVEYLVDCFLKECWNSSTSS